MTEVFRDFLREVKSIKLKEPLAETLGAFNQVDAIVEYGYIDVIKLAGHACPTTSGAYLLCQKALQTLYPDEIPVRGEILVTVFGEPDEGVYGVMSQVISLITGAAPSTGFRGLGRNFRRKDLLKFNPEKIDPDAMCFEFKRSDTGQAVLGKFYPQRIPFPAEKSRRMGELMERVLWEAASDAQKKEFQDLWMEKINDMVVIEKEIDNWLKMEMKEVAA